MLTRHGIHERNILNQATFSRAFHERFPFSLDWSRNLIWKKNMCFPCFLWRYRRLEVFSMIECAIKCMEWGPPTHKSNLVNMKCLEHLLFLDDLPIKTQDFQENSKCYVWWPEGAISCCLAPQLPLSRASSPLAGDPVVALVPVLVPWMPSTSARSHFQHDSFPRVMAIY